MTIAEKKRLLSLHGVDVKIEGKKISAYEIWSSVKISDSKFERFTSLLRSYMSFLT